MSHVDAIAVLLESIKPIALSVQQGQTISRGAGIQPIGEAGVLALRKLSVKNTV
jgi:hypothetical protein